jgi:hypothetical protein
MVPPVVFAEVLDLCPRDDRSPNRSVFEGFGVDRFRTSIARACTAGGVPVFSPHDLRHRRISLMRLAGVPWARIGEQGRAARPRGDRQPRLHARFVDSLKTRAKRAIFMELRRRDWPRCESRRRA